MMQPGPEHGGFTVLSNFTVGMISAVCGFMIALPVGLGARGGRVLRQYSASQDAIQSADFGISLPARSASVWASNLAPAFPRGALTLRPQRCMGISPRRYTEIGLFKKRGCKCVSMMRRAISASARRVIKYHSTQETRVQTRINDAAGRSARSF
jgi:hypothetical protein